jgi:hypothetical protein
MAIARAQLVDVSLTRWYHCELEKTLIAVPDQLEKTLIAVPDRSPTLPRVTSAAAIAHRPRRDARIQRQRVPWR